MLQRAKNKLSNNAHRYEFEFFQIFEEYNKDLDLLWVEGKCDFVEIGTGITYDIKNAKLKKSRETRFKFSSEELEFVDFFVIFFEEGYKIYSREEVKKILENIKCGQIGNLCEKRITLKKWTELTDGYQIKSKDWKRISINENKLKDIPITVLDGKYYLDSKKVHDFVLKKGIKNNAQWMLYNSFGNRFDEFIKYCKL